MTARTEGPDAWLIRKGSYFYRPNCQGYTTSKHEAGRYSEAKAKAEANVEPWHMSAVLADDVPDPPMPSPSFQARVQPWMIACFGPEISADKLERGDRLLEEVLELLQSVDYPRERIASLSSYVWSRPKGEPAREVGGSMVTLAAFCLAHDLDMHAAGETELARVWTKVEAIRAKQAAKPTGSALPVAIEPTPAPDAPHGWVCWNEGPGGWFWFPTREQCEHELSDDIRPATAAEKALFGALGGKLCPDDLCPICLKPLEPDDTCATDIDMGICHAACVDGSPVVDLETGEEVDGKADTYRYGDVAAEEG